MEFVIDAAGKRWKADVLFLDDLEGLSEARRGKERSI